MTTRYIILMSAAMTWSIGCNCPEQELVDLTSDTSDSGDPPTAFDSDDSTGTPFDASRWIGRYHFEDTFLPFGERGYPGGSASLVNFEILPDSRATMFYDDCNFEKPIVINYEWAPSDDGWLNLKPGEGETSLRYLGLTDVGLLRVRLVEPCRELEFDADGVGLSFYIVRPGASCWIDRCTTPGIMQVDYCPGEEPTEPCP